MVIQTRRQARIAQADAAEESPNASPAPDPDVDQITDLVQNASIDSTRHRSTPSEIEELEVDETLLLGRMKDTFTKAGAEDLDVFDVVKELLEEASQAVKSVEEYKCKPKREGWTVTAVSLSRLTSAHMSNLGVMFQQPLACNRFKAVMATLLSHEGYAGIREEFTQWDATGFDNKLQLWDDHIGSRNEAANRIMLYQYIHAAILLCRKNNAFLVIIPEPVLARKGAHARIENKERKTTIFLTGLADYCIITLAAQDERPGLLNDVVEEMKGQKTLDDKLRATRDVQEDANFLLIELKDNTKDLRAHLPQAVGEAILGAHKRQGECLTTPFCLTNTIEWIFGALYRVETGYECWTTETLSMSANFSRQDQLKAMVLLATVSGAMLKETMLRLIE